MTFIDAFIPQILNKNLFYTSVLDVETYED